jgi:hypothetical protein
MFTYSAHFKYEVWSLIDLCINWPISIIGKWLCMHMYFGTIQVLHQIIDRNNILIDGPLGRPGSGRVNFIAPHTFSCQGCRIN